MTSATIKTETAVGEAPGLVPSVSLTAAPSPKALEGRESPLPDESMVLSLVLNDLLTEQANDVTGL